MAALEGPLGLVVLLAVWYFFGAAANVYCKQFLQARGDALSLTLAQYLVGAAAASAVLLARGGGDAALWAWPSKRQTALLGLLSAANGMGHLATNGSMAAVAVSFAHTVKAAEPLFSVALAALLLNQALSRPLIVALLLITIGTALASATELSYSHAGMAAAMASNVLFSSRNAIAKLLQLPGTPCPWAKDSVALFLLLSTAGIALLLPLWIIRMALDGGGGGPIAPLLLAAACHCAYNLTSFLLLARVSPVTHAVANAMRRLFIIAVALLWFANPVTAANVTGTAIACAGVLLYAQATHWLRQRQQQAKPPPLYV